MYKRIIIWIAIVSVLVGITACSEDYLDTASSSSIPEFTVVQSIEELERVLDGIHGFNFGWWQTQGYVGEHSWNIVRDMMGEDLINSATGNGWYISDARWQSHRNPNSNLASYAFYFYHRIVLNCNQVLGNVEGFAADPVVQSAYTRIKGEALALRGWANFQLVQLYAKRYEAGVANSTDGIVLRDGTLDIEPKARATVEESYAAINSDLSKAVELLTKAAPRTKHRMRLGTAYGIRARVALVQQDWANAIAYADSAIKKSGAKLQKGAELLDGFNDYSAAEWMWGYNIADDQGLYYGAFHAYMSWNFSSSNIRQNPKCINRELYLTISPTDIRKQWWNDSLRTSKTKPATNFATKPYENYKFEASPAHNDHILLMRLAEMYLIKAEAQAHSGSDADAAQTLFDLISTRDPNYTLSTNTGQDLLDEVLRHRRIELWGEGFRFTDLKRLNLPLDRNAASNTVSTVSMVMDVPAGDVRWEWVIPKSETDANPLCKQNPL